MKFSLDNIEIPKDTNYPIFELGSWFMVWKESIDWGVNLCETFPYAPDGEVPLIFIDMGRCQITVDSRWLYKTIYERKYGERLDI
jgi:hypothetical protein